MVAADAEEGVWMAASDDAWAFGLGELPGELRAPRHQGLDWIPVTQRGILEFAATAGGPSPGRPSKQTPPVGPAEACPPSRASSSHKAPSESGNELPSGNSLR